jgi:hypothetical protein
MASYALPRERADSTLRSHDDSDKQRERERGKGDVSAL